ncbi:tyrosinase protein [Rutstroemia sp. NJR-2017a WRK4]|nr:tyrosinase protein [Rutstroemia sp. NJR-2017a WRK4]
MKFVQAAAFAVLSATAASAASIPIQQQHKEASTDGLHFYNGTCTPEKITVRKEWRNLSAAQKTAYLEAELCLMALPAQTTLSGVTSRFSDLQALHRSKTNVTLDDADAGNLYQSDMWTADHFGGNGRASDSCVVDGVFANTTEHIGPLLENTDYCYYREWSPQQMPNMTSAAVESCTKYNTYYDFFNCMVVYPDGPHVAGHVSVGGLMADIDCSAGDPTFYLHHNYVDRVWWQWQQADAKSRMFDISGNSLNTTYLEEQGYVAPKGGYVETSLEYVLSVADIVPDVQIIDVVNVQGGYLCYEYDY